jgi:hypothetical protein
MEPISTWVKTSAVDVKELEMMAGTDWGGDAPATGTVPSTSVMVPPILARGHPVVPAKLVVTLAGLLDVTVTESRFTPRRAARPFNVGRSAWTRRCSVTVGTEIPKARDGKPTGTGRGSSGMVLKPAAATGSASTGSGKFGGCAATTGNPGPTIQSPIRSTLVPEGLVARKRLGPASVVPVDVSRAATVVS